ncbi:MAG: CCA tRNA nucleotidyltransferase [bacterium]|nr:CCA tRNA nucleotidyltransferase [bacterium]
MATTIKKEVLIIYEKIKDAGFEVFLVGGCVRDLLIGKDAKDWDLTTNATPEKIQSLFKDSFYDNQFGTVGVPFEKKEDNDLEQKNYVEITTYRREGGYKDLRHPEKIEWGKNIEDDLSRRDFTINAIALGTLNGKGQAESKETFTLDGLRFTLVDPFGGQEDIKKKLIKAVGNPDERFKEDALRLMRAIRFSAQLGFSIEENTLESVIKDSNLLAHISGERVRDELLKILASNYPYEGIKLLDNTGMLDIIIPELSLGKGVSQERPGRHHKDDVFTHNLLSLKFCPSKDPIVKLATLLHDVGKPKSESQDENGLVIFYNHEVSSARIAREIAERLRLSKKQKERIYTLIRWHMFTVDEKITDAAVRRFIRRVGVENVKDIVDLRIGDRLGGGTQTAESWRLKKFKERVEEQLHPPFSLNDIAVNGNDVMEELNLKPGPKVGEILQKLFEEVDEDLSKNNKEYLLKRMKELA